MELSARLSRGDKPGRQVIVNWQIDDKWRVRNSLPAGPAGGFEDEDATEAGLAPWPSARSRWAAPAGAPPRTALKAMLAAYLSKEHIKQLERVVFVMRAGKVYKENGVAK